MFTHYRGPCWHCRLGNCANAYFNPLSNVRVWNCLNFSRPSSLESRSVSASGGPRQRTEAAKAMWPSVSKNVQNLYPVSQKSPVSRQLGDGRQRCAEKLPARETGDKLPQKSGRRETRCIVWGDFGEECPSRCA